MAGYVTQRMPGHRETRLGRKGSERPGVEWTVQAGHGTSRQDSHDESWRYGARCGIERHGRRRKRAQGWTATGMARQAPKRWGRRGLLRTAMGCPGASTRDTAGMALPGRASLRYVGPGRQGTDVHVQASPRETRSRRLRETRSDLHWHGVERHGAPLRRGSFLEDRCPGQCSQRERTHRN